MFKIDKTYLKNSRAAYEAILLKMYPDVENNSKYAGANWRKWNLSNNTAYVMPDGLVFTVSKPHLETSFCFGYNDMYNMPYEDAINKASDAYNNSRTFKNRNLAELRKALIDIRVHKNLFWAKNIGNNGAWTVSWLKYDEWGYNPEYAVRKVTDEEHEMLIAIYEFELEKLTTRVNAYLKKYGTTKLKIWTYYSD